MATTDDGGPKYSVSERARRWMQTDVGASDHACARHRERAPHDARPLSWALTHATIDETIAEHPMYAERPESNTVALGVYRGRTAGGDVYGMIYPITDSDHGALLATTAYRVRSVPAHAQELAGLSEGVGTALKTYLRTLGDQGGIVDE